MMKRILCGILLLLLLCTCAQASPVRVQDQAGLLLSEDVQTLQARADELSERYNVDVIIATTNDSFGMELEDYAADLVDYNDYRTNKIILAVAMDQRGYVCVTTGWGIYAFTDSTLERIYDAMKKDMIAGEYAAAFDTYLELCDSALKQAETGEPYDVHAPIETRSSEKILLQRLLIALVPGVIIGWLIAYSRKRRMNSARAERSAQSYMTHINVEHKRDIYLYTTTKRCRISSSSSGGRYSGSRGGSRTFRGSSGIRHGGGGRGRRF